MSKWLLILTLAFAAYADVGKLTAAGRVKSFTEKTVVVEINKRDFKIKRESIHQKNIHDGDIVLVELATNEEVRSFLEASSKTR